MKQVVTAQDVPVSGELRVPVGTIVTSSAREVAAGRGVRIVEVAEDQLSALAPAERTVAIGSDHGGYRLKEALKPLLESLGLAVRDVGVSEEKPADYPDIAHMVAKLVASGTAARGVIIDGAGIGSCIAANKVPGIRAALCYDKASAKNGREHNDSNVLTLGARLLTQTHLDTLGAQIEEDLLARVVLSGVPAGVTSGAAPRKGEGLNLPDQVCPGCVQRCVQTCARNTKEIIAAGASRVSASEKLTRIDPSIAALIDHTILKPEATRNDVLKICREAREYNFASVCINPYWVPLVKAELSGSRVKVCTVVGFPLGATSTEAKVCETVAALRAGAQEIDMVINVGALRSGDTDAVRNDIQSVVRVAHQAGAIVKVILETALLDDRS